MAFKQFLTISMFIMGYVWLVNSNCLSVIDCSKVKCRNVTSCPEGEIIVNSTKGVCGPCCSYCKPIEVQIPDKLVCTYSKGETVYNVTCQEDQKCCPSLGSCIDKDELCIVF